MVDHHINWSAWIGGYGNDEHKWTWVTGEQWGIYKNWKSSDEPGVSSAYSGEAIIINYNGKWEDVYTYRTHPYICEWETVTNEKYHEWKQASPFITTNSEEYHNENYYCSICNEEKAEHVEHEWQNQYECKNIDDINHGQLVKCKQCGAEIYKPEPHNWEEAWEFPYKLDNTYHHTKYYCSECNAEKFGNKEKHSLIYDSCDKESTLHSKGIAIYYCEYCDSYVKKSVAWKYGTDYSADYEPWFNYIYKSSKSVTVHFDHEAKGAVVKLKIGKKTYKKTIKNSKHSIKFKIKKPSYGKTIQATIYYKGRLIGKSEKDNVLFAKKIKKGMTKKQVRFTRGWGSPDSKGTYSNGWSYWFYNSGAYIGFKNGKVKAWYR